MTDGPHPRGSLSPARRWTLRAIILGAVILLPFLLTFNQPPPQLGTTLGGLKDCPQSPNCVSSDFRYLLAVNAARLFKQDLPPRPVHFVDPIELQADNDPAWKELIETVKRQPGVRVIEATDRYLRAERKTTIYGLIDDFELSRLFDGTVLVRSAARIGYADFGRNRRFVERVRREFADRPREMWF